MSPILVRDRSNYFKKCIYPYHSNPVLHPSVTEVVYDALSPIGPNLGPQHLPPYPTKLVLPTSVRVKTDFDVYHTILYYFLTNSITFCKDPKTTPIPEISFYRFPSLCSTEAIYHIAATLQLDDLKGKALRFLQHTCTAENITPRVISELARLHEEVERMYTAFFRNHYNALRYTFAFQSFFDEIDRRGDVREITWVNSKYRELMLGIVLA
jgi:hypothetical protein